MERKMESSQIKNRICLLGNPIILIKCKTLNLLHLTTFKNQIKKWQIPQQKKKRKNDMENAMLK